MIAKEIQDPVFGGAVWGAFVTGAFSALGEFYYFSLTVSLIAVAMFVAFWVRRGRAFRAVRISFAFLVSGIAVTSSIVGFAMAGLPQAYGLGVWMLYGIFGFSAMQFSLNT